MTSLPSRSRAQSRDAAVGPHEAVVRLAPDVILFLTPEGRIIDANLAAVSAYGYPRDELIGMNISDLRDTETVSQLPDQLEAAAERGIFFETRHRRAGGDTFPVEVHSSALEPVPGEKMLVSIIRDISARRKAEAERDRLLSQVERLVTVAELRARELDGMFEALTDAVLIHDECAVVVQANEAALRTYGFDPVGLPRDEILDRLHIRRPDGTVLRDEEIPSSIALEGGTVEHQRLLFRRADGTDVTIVASASPLVVDARNRGAVTVWRDVTEHERLHLALERKARLGRDLIGLNEMINATLNTEGILGPVIAGAGASIDADGAVIALCRGGKWAVRYAFGALDATQAAEITPHGLAATALTAPRTRPTLIPDATDDRRLDPDVMRALRVRPLLVAPLTVQEEVEGVIAFYRVDRTTPFDSTEVEFVENLSVSLSLALANSKLYEAQREISATLQTALLQTPSSLRGVGVGTAYHSATDEATVGGDFVDVFPVGDQIALLIGDVSGKGIQAVSHASLTKNAVKAYASQMDSPRRVLSLVNEMLLGEGNRPDFVTVFFGLIDPTVGVLRYCCGGHPRPILLGSDDRAILLPTGSPPVGVFADAHYREGVVDLSDARLILLYTDGLIEARRDGRLFGEERLVDLVAQVGRQGPADAACAILEAVRDYAGGRLLDDVAVLAVAPGGPPGH